MNFFRSWVLYNSIFWGLGFVSGLLAGFVFPVIGDVFAVIIFITLVFYFQYKLLRDKVDWGLDYVKFSLISFIIGLAVGFGAVLPVSAISDLSLGHIIAIPITLGITAFGQTIVLSKYGIGKSKWIIANILSSIVATILLFMIQQVVDLRLGLLEVRQADYSAILPWTLIGIIYGCFYGIFTGKLLDIHFNTKMVSME